LPRQLRELTTRENRECVGSDHHRFSNRIAKSIENMLATHVSGHKDEDED
jgi:hypothetical protein